MARTTTSTGSVRVVLALLLILGVLQVHAQRPNQDATSDATTTERTTATSSRTSANLPDLTSASSTSARSLTMTNAPTISSSTRAAGIPFSNLPTLAGAGVPSVGVPNTKNAPYMQKSTMPEGTVFIAVGAILGALGAAVLAWRGAVAWALHRSVKRADSAGTMTDSKALLRGGPAKGIYSTVGASSTLSLDRLHSPNPPRQSKYPSGVPSIAAKHGATPSTTNLFFSPTAGTGMHSATNRSSSYLPAGYYAPGAAQPPSSAHTHNPSNLSIGAPTTGFGRARSIGPSPPGSPALPPSRGSESVIGGGGYGRNSVVSNVGGHGLYNQQQSVSSLNLSAPVHQGRAPSAYLEDLFENHQTGQQRNNY